MDHKRAEEALRESEERFRAAFDQSIVGIVLTDLDGRIQRANPAFCALVGRPLEEFIGRDSSAFTHPEDVTRNVDIIGQLKAQESSSSVYEKRYLRKDGAVAYAQVSISPVRDAKGTPVSLIAVVEDITERKRTDASLARLAEQRRLALDAAQMGWWHYDASTDDVLLDERVQALFGASGRRSSYEDMLALVHPDDRAALDAAVQAATDPSDPRPFSVEYRAARPDGSQRWIESKGKAYFEGEGAERRLVSFVGTAADIHEQKTTQEAIRRSREQMELVVKGANAGVWYCPLPFDRLIWDEKVKEHFHLPPEAEVTIDLFYERIHPDDRARTRAAIEKSISERKPYDIDYRTVSPDGQRTRWIHAIGRAFYGADGEPVRFDGITVDVTDRVNAELAQRQSAELLRAVFEATPECVKLVSPEGALMFMNPAGICMIEAQEMASVQGACVFDLIAPEHRPEWVERHKRVCAGEKLSWVFELIGLSGTRRWMETHAVPLPMPDGRTGQLAVTREITARRQAEADREQLLASERAARTEAERASQLKDEFLATVSHELRTPLNAILGYAGLMRRGVIKPSEVPDAVEVIERNARVQAQIIEDILDMSRIVSGKLRLDVQPVDLSAVVDAALDTVQPAADAKGIRLTRAVDPLLGLVSGDPNRLQQVVWNLLTNAIKFTPKGGRVEVALAREGAQVELSVSDNGQGIKLEFLPHVFDKFRQADASTTRKHGGLGLGLAIVRNLVEMHGGTIRAKSAGEGQGATFVMSLPLSAAHASVEADDHASDRPTLEPISSVDRPSLTEVSVLVVDDEPDARELVRRLLEDCGARVALAASTQEALDVLDRARVDVLVSDIGMPGEDGYQLIRRVRARGREGQGDIPAAALTAFARSEDRRRALQAGYQTHIAKPVEPMELVFAVASLAGMTG
jgi:PAS domain S-box-containing protein